MSSYTISKDNLAPRRENVNDSLGNSTDWHPLLGSDNHINTESSKKNDYGRVLKNENSRWSKAGTMLWGASEDRKGDDPVALQKLRMFHA